MSLDPCKHNPEDPDTSGSEYEQWMNILVDMSLQKKIMYSIIVAAVALAVLPQHVKFFKKRTHEGVSMTSLLMQNIKLSSVAANTFLLKQLQIKACGIVGINECMPSLFSLWQNFLSWIFCFPFLVYWVMFFKTPKRNPKHFTFGVLCLLGFLFYFAVMATVGVLFSVYLGPCADPTIYLAKGLGIFAALLTVVEWAPQIWTTFWTKAARTLSLPMVCVFAPGTLIGAGFMIFVAKDTWSTWLPQLVSGIQLFILLGLLFYFSPLKTKIGTFLQKLSKKPSAEDLAGCGQIELNELPAEVHQQPDNAKRVAVAGDTVEDSRQRSAEVKESSGNGRHSGSDDEVIINIEGGEEDNDEEKDNAGKGEEKGKTNSEC
ncbi:PQ loop repeat protein [Pelomyxa schiedti]|nr:PQ loop repeat protein [Pelomyxa schiedti]